MVGAQPRTSCISLFKHLEILPVPCQYILSLMNSIQESFQTDPSVHNINTRNKHHPLRSNANLSCFQKSIFYADKKFGTVFHLVWQPS